MIKQFIPTSFSNPASVELLVALIADGEFNGALKMSKKLGVNMSDYPESLSSGIRKLLLRHRVGELLSFAYNHPNLVTIDILMVLKAAYYNKDYHAFLKNCVRFKVVHGLVIEIEDALTRLRPEEAASWKLKIQRITDV